MSDILKDYFDALNRLKNGKPRKVPKGSRITNDTVSLEAGRQKGSIKNSRPLFRDLIKDIKAAKAEIKSHDKIQLQLKEAKVEATRYRTLWEQALAREISLVKQLWDEREAWKKERTAYSAGKVTPLTRSKLK